MTKEQVINNFIDYLLSEMEELNFGNSENNYYLDNYCYFYTRNCTFGWRILICASFNLKVMQYTSYDDQVVADSIIIERIKKYFDNPLSANMQPATVSIRMLK